MLYSRFEMIDASRNRMRVKACYGMMVTTIAACLIMVILGKRVRVSTWCCSNEFCVGLVNCLLGANKVLKWSSWSYSSKFMRNDGLHWSINVEQLWPEICTITTMASSMAVLIWPLTWYPCGGGQAAGRHESLTGQNMEKKAKWRQEFQLQQEEAASAAAVSGKAQWPGHVLPTKLSSPVI